MSDDQILVKENVFFLGGFIKTAYKSQEGEKASLDTEVEEKVEASTAETDAVSKVEIIEAPKVETAPDAPITPVIEKKVEAISPAVAPPTVAEPVVTAAAPIAPEKIAPTKQSFAQIVWCRTAQLNEEDRSLLNKILGATKRPISEFQILAGHESISLQEFDELFQYQKLIIFDYEGLMADKYKNMGQVLISDGLDRLQGDKQLKMQLWNCIKAAYIS